MNKKQQKATEFEQQKNAETGLTPVQEKAALLLASGESFTSVAETLGVNRGTLYKWQNLVVFQCFYNLQCNDIRENLKNSLLGLAGEALNAVIDVLHSNNEAVKLKAAQMVIERVSCLPVGETNPKEALKVAFTHNGFDDWSVSSVFDEKGYNKALKDFGLK